MRLRLSLPPAPHSCRPPGGHSVNGGDVRVWSGSRSSNTRPRWIGTLNQGVGTTRPQFIPMPHGGSVDGSRDRGPQEAEFLHTAPWTLCQGACRV